MVVAVNALFDSSLQLMKLKTARFSTNFYYNVSLDIKYSFWKKEK